MARTWEYKTLAMTHGRMGVSKGKVNRPDLEAALTDAGREGWELVHFWPDTSMHQEKDGHLLIFKRPEDAPPVPTYGPPVATGSSEGEVGPSEGTIGPQEGKIGPS